MPSHTSELVACNLRQINTRLRVMLDTFSSAPALALASVQITRLLAELRCAGAWLRQVTPPVEGNIELNSEIESYRRNVERLRDFLPLIQLQLLEERARLAAQQKRIETASKWAQASQQSL